MNGRCFFFRSVILCILLGMARPAYPLAQSAGPEGCNVRGVHTLGFTGRGVKIGLVSARHALVSHEAFFEKDPEGNPVGDSCVHWYDATGDTVPYEPDWHDTSMAGILAGRGGKEYPDYPGMAPAAEIYSVKITQRSSETNPTRVFQSPWIQQALDLLRENGCRVVVTGIQLEVSRDGSFPFTLLYDYYADIYDMIFANAAGNDEDWVTIFGTAYNGLTVGGLVTTEPDMYRRVGERSNPGPTKDGRRKPDLCAPAQDLWVPSSGSDTAWRNEGYHGETSWSAPHVAGVVALLLEYADSSDELYDSRSEVIRAVLVNSAFPNIQNKDGEWTTGQVWNASRGYGRVDALRALDILSQPRIIAGVPTEQDAGWDFRPVGPGQTHTYLLRNVPIHVRLAATLAWNRRVVWKDDPPRNGRIDSGELTGHLADLDLRITDPDGQVLFSSFSTVDNLEKADLLLLKSGDYQIDVVNHSETLSAEYGLAFERVEPIAADFNADSVVNSEDLSLLVPHMLGQSGSPGQDWLQRLDLSGDGVINLYDFQQFSSFWLVRDERYYPLP